MTGRYRWLRAGDLNAFCGLALDNLSNLVILWGLLVGIFRFPPDLVLHRMIPGTAIGVLVGDAIYTWMAFRLARRTARATTGDRDVPEAEARRDAAGVRGREPGVGG